MPAKAPATGRDVASELAYLTRALKAPSLREAVGRLAERARTEAWSHEEFLAACLQREVAARDARALHRIRRERLGLYVVAMVSAVAVAAFTVGRLGG